MIPIRDTIRAEKKPYVVWALLAINVGVFLYQLQIQAELVELARSQLVDAARHHGLTALPARLVEARAQELYLVWLREWGVTPAELMQGGLGEVRAVFTSMFLHGDWLHLAGNMLFLWIFADNVEDRLGHVGFLLFYLGCGVAAVAAQVATAPSSTVPMVGASGALSGALGGYLVLFPHARVLTVIPIFFFLHFVEIPAWVFLVVWFVFQNLAPAAVMGEIGGGGGVAYWAHIGGFVAGAAICLLLRRRLVRRPVQRRGRPELARRLDTWEHRRHR